MPGPAVKFIGADAAMDDLRDWTEHVAPAVAEAAEPLTQRVADVVSQRVPHLSGQLAGSLTTTRDDEGAGVGYDGSVPYDAWIEFGGSRGRDYVPEGRYIYPTAAEAGDEFAQLAGHAAAQSAERFPWSTAQH